MKKKGPRSSLRKPGVVGTASRAVVKTGKLGVVVVVVVDLPKKMPSWMRKRAQMKRKRREQEHFRWPSPTPWPTDQP